MGKQTVVPLEPLTREAFASFGDVIETPGSHSFTINNGSTERFHDLACVDVAEAGGRPLISIFRAQPLAQPVAVTLMERHPLASQAFIPLDGTPFLIIVAPKGESVSPAALRGFISNGRQGVNYHRGVWHHPVLALKADQDFVVIDRGGEGHNCDEFFFDTEQSVILSDFQSQIAVAGG